MMPGPGPAGAGHHLRRNSGFGASDAPPAPDTAMDPAQAIIVLAINLLAIGALFHLIGRRMPADCGLRAIAAGSALFGSAYLLRVVTRFDGALLNVLSSDIAMMTAALLFLRGVRQFNHQSMIGSRRILGLSAAYGLVTALMVSRWGDQGRLAWLALALSVVYAALAWSAASASLRIDTPLHTPLRAPLRTLTALIGLLAVLTALRSGSIALYGAEANHGGIGAQIYYAYATPASALLGPVLIWLLFERLNGNLTDLASRDELTRVLNRKGLDSTLRDHFGGKAGASVTWLQVDIDHFKRINDSHGHAVGDDVLRTVAAVLSNNLRAGDFIARTGGEEFLIGCVGAAPVMALALAERLRTQVAAATTSSIDGDAPLRCTVSIGVSPAFGRFEQWEAAARAADQALYAAKEAGRDRVVAAAA